MSRTESHEILGFQFEPKRNSNVATTSYESSDSNDETVEEFDRAENLSWCECGKCSVMTDTGFFSSSECMCCHEIDSVKYFHLSGKIIIITFCEWPLLITFLSRCWTRRWNIAFPSAVKNPASQCAIPVMKFGKRQPRPQVSQKLVQSRLNFASQGSSVMRP